MKLAALETVRILYPNKTSFMSVWIVLSETGIEMLELEFTADCLAFICRLDSMPPILMEK
jgi:hypothetical protein